MTQGQEKILVNQAKRGSKTAWGQLYRNYQKRLLAFVLQRVESREDAQEILQETFVTVWDALPFYREEASFYTWVCALAKHEMVDFYRRRKIKTVVFSLFPFLEGFASEALGPEGALEKKELQRRIEKIMKLLSEGYQQVLRLKYVEGWSVRQMAASLKETEKAVESRLTRARRAFARLYETVKRGD